MKTLLYNGKIWLGRNYFATVIGLDGETGKIIFIGKNRSDNRNIYSEAIDLKGRLVLPAFTDGHCHLFKGAQVNSEIDLRYAKTPGEFRKRILSYKVTLKSGGWITGGYFSEANFTENFTVDRHLLDGICSDVPIVIFRTDLHSVICNTSALEKLNIESKSGEFSEEEVIRDERGLTGELQERAKHYAVTTMPQMTENEKKSVLRKQVEKLHSYGITSVTDISWREDLDVYKSLLKDSSLNLRINSIIPLNEYLQMEEYKNEFSEYRNFIRLGGVKAFYDGSLSSHSALFHSKYKGKKHNGMRMDEVTSGDFRKLSLEADKMGYQLVVHAIGDLAVSEVLDFAEEMEKLNGIRNRRLRIEHAQHISESDIRRFKKYNIIVSVQPAHIFFDAKTASENIVNPESTHIFSKLRDEGVKLCFGTDFPVVPENPFDSIYYAMTRKAEGYPDGFNTEYALDLITCLEAYTINNAYASYEENIKGSLAAGKTADITVIDTDLFNADTEEIKNAKVDLTFLNGKIVYERQGAAFN
ncbi:MAG: amidohydrolase [Ignavibacteria bacterium]|nr:amidohydrolase [Ignavibacteria bacterium]